MPTTLPDIKEEKDAFSRLADAWASWTGLAIVLSIFIALSIAAADGGKYFGDWINSEKAAAWVQAIGSLMAVVAAFTISNAQFHSAVELQEEARKYEHGRQYETILVLIEGAIDEFELNLNALRGDDPLDWFVRTSANDLMKEYYDVFARFSPFEMPSETAVRSLVSLRDLIHTATWNASRAIQHGTKIAEGYETWPEALAAIQGTPIEARYRECLEFMEDNLKELRDALSRLESERPSI
jgi:hypothetical protein